MTEKLNAEPSSRGAMGEEDGPKCEKCNGSGIVHHIEGVCCGNALPTGECCAARYGTDRLLPVEVGETCPDCGGTGEWRT